MDIQYKIPLGLFKQSIMKLDSLMTDLYEIKEDADLDPEDQHTISSMVEIAGTMEATLLNIVKKELDEDDFLNEAIEMDEIDSYPERYEDILDSPID